MLIDIGVNLTNKRFNDDIDDVLARATEQNVKQILITGTSIEESEAAISLCERFSHNGLFSTAGIHPHDADNAPTDFVERLRSLTSHQCVKAVGECGLDYNRNFSTQENQERVFEAQLALATEVKLPVFLHQRDAFARWQQILNPYLKNLAGGVSHCFTGNLEELKACLDMGLYIGITGWVCDERRGKELFDIIKYIPLDRLMIETDAPYLTPRTIRPKPKSSRNEPSYLPFVLTQVAKAAGKSEQEVALHCFNNSLQLFGLPAA